jgi:hypothetical protein
MFNTKAALQKAALLLIEIERSNGCSLKFIESNQRCRRKAGNCTVPPVTKI